MLIKNLSNSLNCYFLSCCFWKNKFSPKNIVKHNKIDRKFDLLWKKIKGSQKNKLLFRRDKKWLKKDIWGTVGKNRKDVFLSGREIRITNSKLGHLGGSQADVAMVIKQIHKWLVAEDIDGKIGSVLHSQR